LSQNQDHPLFSIQDSDVNVSEIMREIEENIKRRNIRLEDIQKITKISLNPETPLGHRKFDPSNTAHLFEKGISPPKFTNPIFRYVKGPFRWLFVKFIESYSLFDKKISENRIKAFFSVVYELVLLRNRYEKLESKVNELTKELSDIKVLIKKTDLSNIYNPYNPLQENLDIGEERILYLLKENEKTLLLFPDKNSFLQRLVLKNIPFHSIVYSKSLFDYFRNNITNQIELVEDFSKFQKYSGFKNIIFVSNACLLPGYLIENIIYNIHKYSDPGTKVLFRFYNSSLKFYSPFQENYQTRISVELLNHFLKEEGFKNIVQHSVEDGELNLITFQKT
jgi:hypothetical protein